MNKDEMLASMRRVGALKEYKPYLLTDERVFGLHVRKPARIVDGLLKGSEVTFDGTEFRVWSPRKKLCKALAGTHKIPLRLYDTEAELWVPGRLADRLLPMFGVKVKPNRPPLTEDQLKAFKERFKKAREARSLPPILTEKGTSGD